MQVIIVAIGILYTRNETNKDYFELLHCFDSGSKTQLFSYYISVYVGHLFAAKEVMLSRVVAVLGWDLRKGTYMY